MHSTIRRPCKTFKKPRCDLLSPAKLHTHSGSPSCPAKPWGSSWSPLEPIGPSRRVDKKQAASQQAIQPATQPTSQPASELTYNDCGKEPSGRQGKTKRPWSESPRMPPNMNAILSKEFKKELINSLKELKRVKKS